MTASLEHEAWEEGEGAKYTMRGVRKKRLRELVEWVRSQKGKAGFDQAVQESVRRWGVHRLTARDYAEAVGAVVRGEERARGQAQEDC